MDVVDAPVVCGQTQTEIANEITADPTDRRLADVTDELPQGLVHRSAASHAVVGHPITVVAPIQPSLVLSKGNVRAVDYPDPRPPFRTASGSRAEITPCERLLDEDHSCRRKIRRDEPLVCWVQQRVRGGWVFGTSERLRDGRRSFGWTRLAWHGSADRRRHAQHDQSDEEYEPPPSAPSPRVLPPIGRIIRRLRLRRSRARCQPSVRSAGCDPAVVQECPSRRPSEAPASVR